MRPSMVFFIVLLSAISLVFPSSSTVYQTDLYPASNLIATSADFHSASLDLASSPSPMSYDPPHQIRLSWTEDPSTTMTILWHTNYDTSNHTVKFGLSKSNYTWSSKGSSFASPVGGTLHTAELTGLSPDTTYYYVVGDNSSGWSIESSFRTSPSSSGNNDTSFSFVAFGDSRQTIPYVGTLEEWAKIARAAATLKPSFSLFTGDMVIDPTDHGAWDEWFTNAEILTSKSPLFPAVGNHELAGDPNLINYKASFTLPNNERWYSFNYSSAHLITLDAGSSYQPGSDQYRWLADDLSDAQSNRASRPWIILSIHNPPYTASGPEGHSSDTSVQQDLVPLFDQYHVDLVLNGHNHFYQRTYPMMNGNIAQTDKRPNDYSDPKGTVYVITGGAGAPLYSVGSSPLFAYSLSTYHLLNITISKGRLQVQALTDALSQFDQFTITKNSQSEVAQPIAQLSPEVTSLVIIGVFSVAGLAIIAYLIQSPKFKNKK